MLIKDYLPSFFINKDLKKILDQEQIEIDNYNILIKDLLNQCFVNTATWGLKYWEELLGIKTNVYKNIEFRRTTIIAKLRGQGTTTKSLIKNVAESFSNGEVEVIENNKNYSFTIKFVGSRGIPPNLADLKNAIEDIKPAHLGVLWEFLYNTWAYANKFTWEKLSKTTWQDLKENDLKE